MTGVNLCLCAMAVLAAGAGHARAEVRTFRIPNELGMDQDGDLAARMEEQRRLFLRKYEVGHITSNMNALQR